MSERPGGGTISLFSRLIIPVVMLIIFLNVLEEIGQGMGVSAPQEESANPTFDPEPFTDIAHAFADVFLLVVPLVILTVVGVRLAIRAYRRQRYSLRAVGVVPRTTAETLDESGICVNCWEDAEKPYSIAYGRDYVVAGVVVWRRVDGEILECQPCRDADEIEYAQRAADPSAKASPVQEGAA